MFRLKGLFDEVTLALAAVKKGFLVNLDYGYDKIKNIKPRHP